MSAPLVMKFGGSSVADAERITHVAEIIGQQTHRPLVVVVSAMSGVTDLLIKITENIHRKDADGVEEHLREVFRRHQSTVGDFRFDPGEKHQLAATMTQQLNLLKTTVRRIMNSGTMTPRDYDAIVSFGERLNIHLVAAAVHHEGIKSQAVEASSMIVTTDHFTDAKPLLEESAPRALEVLGDLFEAETVPIVTGFVGATKTGEVTTLGRGASDYTATILGYCLTAAEVWIWTDVTGVMTADPRMISDAQTIKQLSYDEAAELSYFGAKVLHPLTMVPASLKNIPIYIKNTFEPQAVGTVISATASSHGVVKAVSVKSGLSMVTVRGKGVSGAPAILSKVFDPLAEHKIDVFFITHASSEHNISFIVKSSAGKRTVSLVREILAAELDQKTVETVDLQNGLALIAVVGREMDDISSITGQLFMALGASGVTVLAISQGSSDHNISCVIDDHQTAVALKTLHQTFKLVSDKASRVTFQTLFGRR
ncbi:MAG: aspartate kinase [Candidatus Saccharimonadales bacterium]